MSFIFMKQADIKPLREKLTKEQNGLCAICQKPLGDRAALDHQHRKKSDPVGLNGGGLIRGVLNSGCNIMEGKLYNNCQRYGISHAELPTWLRQLADYLEQDNHAYVHPSEVPKDPKVSKRNYNKLKKVYNKKAKFPEYPKSAKLNKKLKELFEEFDINPYN